MNKKSKCMMLMVKSNEMIFVSTRIFFVNKMMFNTRYTNKEKDAEEKKKQKLNVHC